ncbi:hypothetical protein F5X68DRAFT_266984 [Plectosphaerella plurivora]|uniref:Uncharacterized protein n=1 Tax=Plectosphaerella plurivora TaxID=936078 RepID=A0A9P9AGK3_9PEZI|nr:hypothetical protein F5X68DRAFT_266984 [Plectosphaerella plurivora]
MAANPVPVLGYSPDQPTASHQLAEEATDKPPEEKGHAEVNHGDVEVKNLGWNSEHPDHVPSPLVGGLSNEDLWILVRRFDKQIFQVKSIPEAPLAELDLNIAEEEEFSPEKLRAQIERLYMTVIVGLFSFSKQIVRLRSWRETRRTSAFLAVYTAAWLLDVVVPVVSLFLMVLVLHPPSRVYCFPPAPPALIDSSTGGVKKPASGVLASEDSITGAPEKYRGEAVEQEAHSFVSSISSLVVSTAAGKHPQGDPPNSEESAAPDPADVTQDVVSAKDKSNGAQPGTSHDKTKKPVTQAVWVKARPAMHGLAEFVDTWERFGNALSPTAPFHRHRPRLILAGVVLPIFLTSLVTSPYMVIKSTQFILGFAFFGDPIIQRGLSFVNRRIPNWQKYLELRNSILKGVPTDAQLTLTLLRIGERNKAPLPPPPRLTDAPSSEPNREAVQNLDHLGISQAELDEAIQPDEDALAPAGEDTHEEKPNKGRRLLNLIKGTAKGGVNTTLAANKLKAEIGSHHARDRLGVVKKHEAEDPPKGPVRFPARFNGKRGHAYITATATSPALSWTSESEDINPVWTLSIGDIVGVRKLGGLGWKSKIIVGWATEREIADSLAITDVKGCVRHLTAITTRDELFNRLIAIGTQIWEAW